MNMISYFTSLPSKGQPHISSRNLSVSDFLNKIKYGEWEDIVEKIRLEKDKDKRNSLKRSLPSVTVSGTFKEREQDKLLEHSGFIQIDIDNYKEWHKLKSDPYIFAIFSSCSATGACAIIKILSEKHKESFKWLQNYFYKTYGINVDPAPQNVASLRYVSFDPNIYINEKSKKSLTLSVRQKKSKSLPIVLTEDKLGKLVYDVSTSGTDLAPDYDSYMRICFAFSSLGEPGRTLLHSICQNSPKYNQQQTDKKFDYCLKQPSKSTLGTFYYLCTEHGFSVDSETSKYVSTIAMAKKSGRKKEAVVSQLNQLNGLDNATANRLVDEVFSRSDITINSLSGNIENLTSSVIEWMNLNHNFKRNELTKIIEEKGVNLTKEKINTIYLKARMFFNTKDINKDLITSIIHSENTPDFNPITEYINKNNHRDKTGNIDVLIQSINSNTTHYDFFIRKWLLGVIAAYYGFPVRSVLVLTGGQNTGKTEWFRRLLPTGLKKYYAESTLDAGKDDELLMCQKLIVMDDEMGGKSKNDEKRFKDLSSKAVFSLRAPYGTNNEDFKRLAVLCGTSNEQAIINDPTGNTRILPVEVISIDHDLYNSIDKDELFMEIYRCYEEGEEWILSKNEIKELTETSIDFNSINFEQEIISKFFEVPEHSYDGEFLTATDIKNHIETYSKQRILSLRKLGIELKKFFGNSKNVKRNSVSLKCYFVKKNEISRNFEKSGNITGEATTIENNTDNEELMF